ncbi:glucosaminidase domain-containing protein [Agaribacterium haliotis]|uniref:glucosaminidase domain-containing protein n=1 Tax=Agaribacterium haliotis TaxID=2013869 RepID=UPI0013044C34|nr:glucosaminidase domain-containing protein [Agaribacterium haliotis]
MLLLVGACQRQESSDAELERSSPSPLADIKNQPLQSLHAAHQSFVYSSYQDLIDLFAQYNYTPEAWQAGLRQVPRLYFTSVPKLWSSTASKQLSVLNKKRLFFRGLAPLVLRSNELIYEQREHLIELQQQAFEFLPEKEKQWLLALARSYKVIGPDDTVLSEQQFELLEQRVDIIPVSLALAQGAIESGWGTSRFASEGNALFGQWAWGEHAMKPAEQRKHLGNYGLEAYESPLQSVIAYMHNLNTHRAYQALRDIRLQMRQQGLEPSGTELANGLDKYSEKGRAYVELLHSMISYNHLAGADDAYLADSEALYLVPAVSSP